MNNINTLGHYISSLQQSIVSVSVMATNLSKELKALEDRVKLLEDYNESINKTITEHSNFPPVLDIKLENEETGLDIEIVPKKKKIGKKGAQSTEDTSVA